MKRKRIEFNVFPDDVTLIPCIGYSIRKHSDFKFYICFAWLSFRMCIGTIKRAKENWLKSEADK